MIRTLTYDMAMAAARDEANRNMRRMGRKAWDADDYNVAVETFERIFGVPKHYVLPLAHFKYLDRRWTKISCAGRFSELTGACDMCDAVLVNGRQI